MKENWWDQPKEWGKSADRWQDKGVEEENGERYGLSRFRDRDGVCVCVCVCVLCVCVCVIDRERERERDLGES